MKPSTPLCQSGSCRSLLLHVHLWAVLSGLVVFGDIPNWLSMIGIGLILASGLASIALDQRAKNKGRISPAL